MAVRPLDGLGHRTWELSTSRWDGLPHVLHHGAVDVLDRRAAGGEDGGDDALHEGADEAGAASRRCRGSTAAVTAPQLSWPRTTISGTSSTSTLYSREPSTASSMTWPGGADHEHVTEAHVEDDLGGQPGIRAAEDHGDRVLSTREVRRAASWLGCATSPATKRSLPSRSRRQAWAGVS